MKCSELQTSLSRSVPILLAMDMVWEILFIFQILSIDRTRRPGCTDTFVYGERHHRRLRGCLYVQPPPFQCGRSYGVSRLWSILEATECRVFCEYRVRSTRCFSALWVWIFTSPESLRYGMRVCGRHTDTRQLALVFPNLGLSRCFRTGPDA